MEKKHVQQSLLYENTTKAEPRLTYVSKSGKPLSEMDFGECWSARAEIANGPGALRRTDEYRALTARLSELCPSAMGVTVASLQSSAGILESKGLPESAAIFLAHAKQLLLEGQLILDRLAYGSSFELNGVRVDPRRVLLKKDGTYELVDEAVAEEESKPPTKPSRVGQRGKFFHPKTLGTMEYGVLLKDYGNGTGDVKFDRHGPKGQREFLTTINDAVWNNDGRVNDAP